VATLKHTRRKIWQFKAMTATGTTAKLTRTQAIQMADDGALPQEEIDKLLSGDIQPKIDAAREEPQTKIPGIFSQDEINGLLDEAIAKEIAAKEASAGIDAENPQKFSKAHLRVIHSIHEKFAQLAVDKLVLRLKCNPKMSVASIDQVTMGEFFRIIPIPSLLAVISMEPLKGKAVFEMDPSVAFTVVDKIRGGGKTQSISQRVLTPAEKNIMENIYIGFMENLRDAWAGVTKLQPRLERLETDPAALNIFPPAQNSVLVTFEATFENSRIDEGKLIIQETQGMLNLCIPYTLLEPLLEKL
jgi:flagellar motor switch protein FliM